MKKDIRVLSRVGARDLTVEEVAVVTGALNTLTPCTIGLNNARDGDVSLHEC